MLSTELRKKSSEEAEFAIQNLENLQNQIVILDNQKRLYDDGIEKLERDVFNSITEVNEDFSDVASAYQDRIDSECRTDLFWRLVGINSASIPSNFILECTKLNSGGYSLTTSSISHPDVTDDPTGAGTSVGYVGATGIVTYYPANESFAAEYEGDPSVENNPYFGFDRRNRYALKYYSEPYDKDIGNTFVGNFIGTVRPGTNQVTVMQPVGAGLTFREGQLVSVGKTSVFQTSRTITGISTQGDFDLRVIPGIGTTGVTVNILTLNLAVGAGASAPEPDGSFVEFTVLDDPAEFQDEGRRKYAIDFSKNPFVPQSISIATNSNIGIGVSVFLSQTGDLPNAQSWDPGTIFLGESEPNVSGGQEFYTIGFGHAPMIGASKATEGAVLETETLSAAGLYSPLSACTTEIEDAITSTLGISSASESALIDVESDVLLKLDASQALRDNRNEIQLQIFGIRKILGDINVKVDRQERLQTFLGFSTVSDTIG